MMDLLRPIQVIVHEHMNEADPKLWKRGLERIQEYINEENAEFKFREQSRSLREASRYLQENRPKA